jgi:hypothetical protein
MDDQEIGERAKGGDQNVIGMEQGWPEETQYGEYEQERRREEF